MAIVEILLLGFLIACAVAVALTKHLWHAVIIFMSYSFVMSVVWAFLQAPDLAVTEAAVGAGITGILFFMALKRISTMRKAKEEGKQEDSEDYEDS